jgi:uncharacterized membrane protein
MPMTQENAAGVADLRCQVRVAQALLIANNHQRPASVTEQPVLGPGTTPAQYIKPAEPGELPGGIWLLCQPLQNFQVVLADPAQAHLIAHAWKRVMPACCADPCCGLAEPAPDGCSSRFLVSDQADRLDVGNDHAYCGETDMSAAQARDDGNKEGRDPLRFHLHYQHGDSPYAGGSSFMERVSEAVASGMGTVAFLVASSTLILAWVLANHVIGFLHSSWTGLLNGKGFDPAPFILLNLLFSAVAFYTGALVIIAQKAQTRTDRANQEAAAKHREELNQYQTALLQKNTDMTEQIQKLTEQLHILTKQVHDATCGHSPAGVS